MTLIEAEATEVAAERTAKPAAGGESTSEVADPQRYCGPPQMATAG